MRPLRVVGFGLALAMGILALVNCDDSSGGGGSSGGFDAGTSDVSFATDTGGGGRDDGATGDGSADGGADAAPQVDEAGCPLSTGPTSSLTDAGIPTTGLTLWLRADHGVATPDGTKVCRWDDQSGNGYSFKPNGTTPPTLAAAGIKNHPALSFVGNQELARPDVLGLGATSGRTIAIYGLATDLGQRFHYFIQGEVASPGVYVGLDQNTYQTAGHLEGVYVANNSFDSNVATANVPRSQILSVSSLVDGTSLPGALVYEVDGTVSALSLRAGGGAVQSFATANFTSIGALDFTTQNWGGAFLGEVIVWNRALTDLERADVEAHFQAHFQ